MEEVPPKVSIVVTSLNAEEGIADCLRSLFSQDYGNFEVILVDGGSSDSTVEKAREVAGECAKFRAVVDDSAKTPAAGRNRGVKIASGEFVAFTDSDCEAKPDWISILMSPQHWVATTGAIGGKTLFTKVSDDRGMLKALHAAIATGLGSGGSAQFLDRKTAAKVRSLPSCNVIYRKNVFETYGGFDETLRFCEDSCLNALIRKHGFKLTYLPEAVIRHGHRSSVLHFVSWTYNYGKGRASAMRRDINAFSLPALSLVFAPVLLITLAIHPTFTMDVVLPLVFGIYFGLVIASSLLNTGKWRRGILRYIVAYFLIHLSYVVGLFVGLVHAPSGKHPFGSQSFSS